MSQICVKKNNSSFDINFILSPAATLGKSQVHTEEKLRHHRENKS